MKLKELLSKHYNRDFQLIVLRISSDYVVRNSQSWQIFFKVIDNVVKKFDL